MTIRLTKTVVEELEGSERDRLVWDDRLAGFGVKITPIGARIYVFQYRTKHARITRRYTLGRHGSPWTTERAREAASNLAARVRLGEDPFATDRTRRVREHARAEEAVAKRVVRQKERIDDIVTLYIERYAKPKNRRWAETERIFKRDVLPHWNGRSIRSITRKDIIDLIDGIQDRAPTMARNVFAQLRKFFNWCVERDLIGSSPLQGFKAPPAAKARDRWLNDREMALFWKGCEALGPPFGPLFQVLLLTAQRREEVSGMRWNELDLAKAEWLIPAGRAKNRKEHVVDLGPQAIALVNDRSRDSEFVFTTTGDTPVSGHGHAKALLDLHIETVRLALADRGKRDEFGVLPPWRIHDLRRTAATGMSALGFPPHVVEAVLNHKSGVQGGLVAVYQHYQYRAERKAALISWDLHLAAINATAPSV